MSLEKKPDSQLSRSSYDEGDDLARTHMMTPLRAVTAPLTGISWPFSSFAFATLNTERTDEMRMKIVASTK
jgi:hypothetical protein